MQETTEVSGYEGWTGWGTGREPAETHTPEDRILRAGAESLNDQELLAALLGMDVSSADRLLELHAGQLFRLFSGGSWAVSSLRPTQRARFLAARELACRLAAERLPQSDPLLRPEDMARFLSLRYCVRDQEVLGVLFLTNSGQLISHGEIYRGTLDAAKVEPREILKQALLVGAASLIVFHTHPSGDPSPSLEDRAFTRNLADAAQIIGIPLRDHLVLGSAGRWTSLRDLMAW